MHLYMCIYYVYICLCILIAPTLLIDLKDWYFSMTGREGIKDGATVDTWEHNEAAVTEPHSFRGLKMVF